MLQYGNTGETYARHRGGKSSVAQAVQEMRDDVKRATFDSRKYKLRTAAATAAGSVTGSAAATTEKRKDFRAQGERVYDETTASSHC